MIDQRKQQGFTLLETVVYLGLFAIVIGGGMIATYEIIQSSGKVSNQAMVSEEANFLLSKINWGLSGATAISIPSSTTLVATKIINSISTNLTFTLSGSNLTLQRGANTAQILNSSNVTVSNLNFTNIPASGGIPQGVTMSLTITSRGSGGVVSRDFSTTKYLRQ